MVFGEEFRELFENDARAQLWVGATSGEGLLVLDEHDLVLAYGPLERLASALEANGFAPGVPEVPDPHEHHYNVELDHLETRLLEARVWRRVLPPDGQAGR